MAWKQKQKEKAAAAAPPKPKEPEFDPNADLSKMSLPEQLKWNMMKMKLA